MKQILHQENIWAGSIRKSNEKRYQQFAVGKDLFLRDIISNPPACLGCTLFEEAQSEAIKNAKYLRKIDGIAQYQKL